MRLYPNLNITEQTLLELIRGTHWLASKYRFIPIKSLAATRLSEDFYGLANAMFSYPDEQDRLNAWLFYLLYSHNQPRIRLSDGRASFVCRFVRGHIWNGKEKGPIGSADVVLVGKAPGNEEVAADRNFVGPSGQLLYECLQEVGFTKSEIDHMYVTNIVRWVAENRAATTLPMRWITDCKPLLEEEVRLLKPRALVLLGSDAVKGVFGGQKSLNRVAASNSTLTFADIEGNPFEVQLFAVLHPAAVCRQPELREALKAQLARLREYLTTNTIVSKNSKIVYETITDISGLDRCIQEIVDKPGLKKVALDLEWHGQFPTNSGSYIRTIQLCESWPKAYIIKLFDQQGNLCFQPDLDAVRDRLTRFFLRDDIQIGGSFLLLDLCWLADWLKVDISKLLRRIEYEEFYGGKYAGIFDVALAEHARNETGSFDLETMACLRAGYVPWSQKLEAWKSDYCRQIGIPKKDLLGYGSCPDDILLPYAAIDAAATRDLMDIQCQQLFHDGYGLECWRPFYIAMSVYPALLEMYRTGITIDKAQLEKLSLEYSLLYAEKLQQFREQINWPTFNPRSVIYDCVEFLFGERYTGIVDTEGRPIRKRPEGAISLGLTPIKTTDGRLWSTLNEAEQLKTRPSTDRQVCGILSTQSELAAKLRDLRLLDQVLKTVLRTESDGDALRFEGIGRFIHDDGKVHSLFMPILKTGRCNSVRPQMQNLAKQREATYSLLAGERYPGPLRSIVVPSKGYKLVEADYKIAELFCMAVFSQDKTLLEHCRRANLNPDHPDYFDIHSNIAVKAFRLNCKPVKESLKEKGFAHYRIAAKAIVYGSLYGRGAAAIQLQCLEEGTQVSFRDVERLLDTFFETYPALRVFQEKTKQRVFDPGWIRTYYGRCRRFYPVSEPELIAEQQREAMNFLPQATVADSMSLALSQLYFHPDKEKLGYRIICQIHDACLLEVPERFAQQVAYELIPECLCEKVQFKACNLDGVAYPNSDYYRFDVDVAIFDRWA